MYLIAALITFALFVSHIFIGSVWGVSFIGDIGELIILLCASVLFVVAILRAERLEKSGKHNS